MTLPADDTSAARSRERLRQARQRSARRSRPRTSVLALSIESLEPEHEPFAERLRDLAHPPPERILGDRADLRDAVAAQQPARLGARVEVGVGAVELAADRA